MRYCNLQGYRATYVLKCAESALEDLDFKKLHSDNHHLYIEAIKEDGMINKKHLSVRISKLKTSLEVCIEVRNVGLELKRERQNDLLEAKLERMLHSHLRKDDSKVSVA